MSGRHTLVLLCFLGLAFLAGSCVEAGKHKEPWKILYINSYHRGYPHSDEIEDAIFHTLPTSDYKIEVVYLNAKRNGSPNQIQQQAIFAWDLMRQWNPNLLIVSDDPAARFIAEPMATAYDMPIVFCGVNWTASEYNLPQRIVTGMVEVSPIQACIDTLIYYYPKVKKVAVLSEQTETELKNKHFIEPFFHNSGLGSEYRFVSDLDEWKAAFLWANANVDAIYLSTNGAIKGWDREIATNFVRQNMKIPVFTSNDFMMPYAVFGLTKVPREQGEWAAQTAAAILQKTQTPSGIGIVENVQVKAYINPVNAAAIGFKPTPQFLSRSAIRQ